MATVTKTYQSLRAPSNTLASKAVRAESPLVRMSFRATARKRSGGIEMRFDWGDIESNLFRERIIDFLDSIEFHKALQDKPGGELWQTAMLGEDRCSVKAKVSPAEPSNLNSGIVAAIEGVFSTRYPDCDEDEFLELDAESKTNRVPMRYEGRLDLPELDASETTEISPKMLYASNPELLDQLDQLDDAVYDALMGKEEAIDEVRKLWPALKGLLPEPLIDESREQFVRQASEAIRGYRENSSANSITNSLIAMELVEVLLQ